MSATSGDGESNPVTRAAGDHPGRLPARADRHGNRVRVGDGVVRGQSAPSRVQRAVQPGRLSTAPAAMALTSCAWSLEFWSAYERANRPMAAANLAPFPM